MKHSTELILYLCFFTGITCLFLYCILRTFLPRRSDSRYSTGNVLVRPSMSNETFISKIGYSRRSNERPRVPVSTYQSQRWILFDLKKSTWYYFLSLLSCTFFVILCTRQKNNNIIRVETTVPFQFNKYLKYTCFGGMTLNTKSNIYCFIELKKRNTNEST